MFYNSDEREWRANVRFGYGNFWHIYKHIFSTRIYKMFNRNAQNYSSLSFILFRSFFFVHKFSENILLQQNYLIGWYKILALRMQISFKHMHMLLATCHMDSSWYYACTRFIFIIIVIIVIIFLPAFCLFFYFSISRCVCVSSVRFTSFHRLCSLFY